MISMQPLLPRPRSFNWIWMRALHPYDLNWLAVMMTLLMWRNCPHSSRRTKEVDRRKENSWSSAREQETQESGAKTAKREGEKMTTRRRREKRGWSQQEEIREKEKKRRQWHWQRRSCLVRSVLVISVVFQIVLTTSITNINITVIFSLYRQLLIVSYLSLTRNTDTQSQCSQLLVVLSLLITICQIQLLSSNRHRQHIKIWRQGRMKTHVNSSWVQLKESITHNWMS